MISLRTTIGPVLATALFLAACNKTKDAPEAQAPTAERAETPAGNADGGMQGMGGMSGGTLDQMDAHMMAMMGAAADSMKALLPEHRQMVANMLAQMGAEMRQMNMKTDAAWDALTDSVRADLTRMPEMSAEDLKTMMESHEGRVRRLMDMHKGMTGGMKM